MPTDLNRVIPGGRVTPPSSSPISASGLTPAWSRSPASIEAAPRSSTTRNADRTTEGGTSAMSEVNAPTALMWMSPESASGEKSGVVEGVTVVMIWAPSIAASGESATEPCTRRARDSAFVRSLFQIRISEIGRTAFTARTWSKPIAPAPRRANLCAPSGARILVARPDAAPVRIAVRVGPSTEPMGTPSSSNTVTIPTGFPGTIDTTLTPEILPTRAGMKNDDPSNWRCGISRSLPNAVSMAEMASIIGRAARVSSASRILTIRLGRTC